MAPSRRENPPRARRSREPRTIDGPAVRAMFAAGAEALRANADAINAINVFPVPDGDTGTNMSLTMAAAVDECARDSSTDARQVAEAAARGALIGARGNSGVILSQILRGFAEASGGQRAFDAPAIADGLERARAAAYAALSAPREGTILSAIAAAARAAAERASVGGSARATVDAATTAARAAVALTPDYLPVLRDAGVVDAGAQGLVVLLEAASRVLRGDRPMAPVADRSAIDASWLAERRRLHRTREDGGYCVEFIVSHAAGDDDAVRERLEAIGDSVLVVRSGDLLRVHVHAPGAEVALAYGASLGPISHEKVDPLAAQIDAFIAAHEEKRPAMAFAAIAVANGRGIAQTLRSLGAAAVIYGGRTMSPSVDEIRASVEAIASADVIFLPGNMNTLRAAEQVAHGVQRRIHVVAALSVPQIVAALVVMNVDATVEENTAAMKAAVARVRTGEVRRTSRPTNVDGKHVPAGYGLAVIEGVPVVADETADGAVRSCVERMIGRGSVPLVTLYSGADVPPTDAERIARQLGDAFGVEVDVVAGGQPDSQYIIGVE